MSKKNAFVILTIKKKKMRLKIETPCYLCGGHIFCEPGAMCVHSSTQHKHFTDIDFCYILSNT